MGTDPVKRLFKAYVAWKRKRVTDEERAARSKKIEENPIGYFLDSKRANAKRDWGLYRDFDEMYRNGVKYEILDKIEERADKILARYRLFYKGQTMNVYVCVYRSGARMAGCGAEADYRLWRNHFSQRRERMEEYSPEYRLRKGMMAYLHLAELILGIIAPFICLIKTGAFFLGDVYAARFVFLGLAFILTKELLKTVHPKVTAFGILPHDDWGKLKEMELWTDIQ